MKIEPRRQNSVSIRLGDREAFATVAEEFFPESITIEELITIPGTCYGMDIYTTDGRREYYGTQSRVKSAKMDGRYLLVYEEGKSLPWKFNSNGMVIHHARFDENNKEDVSYVKEKYGLSKKDIPNLNDYDAYVEYISEIEPKINCPITISLKDPKYSKERYLDETGKSKIPLEMLNASIYVTPKKAKIPLSKGVMLNPERPKFGFKVISARKMGEFATQCPLIGVQIVDNEIHVYEEGKTLPWRFDASGDLLDYAKFVDISKRDIRYLIDNFCLTMDDVENVNSYGLKYVNKN